MRWLLGVYAALFIASSMLFFSIDRLVFSSYELFSGPGAWVFALEPHLTAFFLFVSLALALLFVYAAARRLSSQAGAWAALVLVSLSAPVLLAPFSIGLGFLAAPLLIILTYQLSTRRYRLLSISIPIALLFVLGFGHYPLLVLGGLLLASPLRPDPDPRIGELFLLVSIAFVAFARDIPLAPSLDRTLPLGLVFIALGVFAVYRVVSRGSRRADPIVSLALASSVLFVLGDPLAPLALALSAGVLVSIGFASVFRFFELSKIPFKRSFSFSFVVICAMLTLTQSVFIIASTERMTPALASSLSGIEPGVVAIDERLSPALGYFSEADPVPLSAEDIRLFESSRFTTPVIAASEDRFSRVLLFSEPPYVSSECFVLEQKGILVEVRIRCSLS